MIPKPKIAVVVPNWNGRDVIGPCLDSLMKQTELVKIIVVDNGSTDGSVKMLESDYPRIELIKHSLNKGFAGGVNAGLRFAMDNGYKYAALLNNDAVAEEDWSERLAGALDKNPSAGIATSKILDKSERRLDSTGDFYTSWGLPDPRGRGELDKGQYDNQTKIFGASGGASIYRIKMIEEVGPFDEDFFAYYEDIDISFRAQLAGWKILYEPSAIAFHTIGETSGKIPGFTTYQTLKNLPQLFWKNVPIALWPEIMPRFVVLYCSIYVSAVARGQFVPATKGLLMSVALWPKKLIQRYKIQSRRKVSSQYISSIIIHDLPPNAHKLRRLRRYLSLGRAR